MNRILTDSEKKALTAAINQECDDFPVPYLSVNKRDELLHLVDIGREYDAYIEVKRFFNIAISKSMEKIRKESRETDRHNQEMQLRLQINEVKTECRKDKFLNKNTETDKNRKEERQLFLERVWSQSEKPKKNDPIWKAMKKMKSEKGPILDVIGNVSYKFEYEDGSTEQITKKTFQNDMSIVRKLK